MKLRAYQEKLISDLRESIKRGNRSAVAVLGCGGGKSVIMAAIAKSAAESGSRVLFLVHRKELCNQISATFESMGVNMSMCDIMMVQTASRRADKLPEYQLILTDECFTSDTLIDGKPLTNLKCGDIITSYNGKTIEGKPITHVFKKRPSSLMGINLSDGTLIKCTPNHPVYIEGTGYIPAKEIKEGQYVRRIPVHNVREACAERGFYEEAVEVKNGFFQKIRKNLLLSGMLKSFSFEKFKHHYGENESEVRQRKNEKKQSDEKSGNKEKSFCTAERNRPLPKNPVWKRCWADCSSASAFDSLEGNKTVCRICNSNKVCGKVRNALSGLLQSGHCSAGKNACNRSGWKQPFCLGSKRTGQEEGVLLEHVRVERIEVYQQTSDGTFGGMCPDGYVYNFEVKDNHNYFANGILVHNCHHSTVESYRKVYSRFPDSVRIGFTATPIRLNRGGLGEVYEDLIQSVSTGWLIENHFLAPYRYYSVKLADTSKLHTRAGEFDQSEVLELMENNTIYGDTVKQWERLAKGKKTIIYCASVEAAKETANEFFRAGIPADSIDGSCPQQHRAEIMRRFRNGEITVLCNCELFGEGLDVPDCECVVLLRPTQSLSLHIQQSMRSMRYRPGKTAIIIDHVGNCYRHGLPDDEREWSLKPKKAWQKEIKIRECPNCFAVYPPTLPKCPYCGYEAVREIRTSERKTVEVDLVEIKRQQDIRETPLKDADLKTWEEIVEFQKLHKYKFAWCLHHAEKNGIEIPAKYKYMARRYIQR